MRPRSCSARQPVTTTFTEGSAFFTAFHWPMRPYARCSALSRTVHVLRTSTEASSGRAASVNPAASARRTTSCESASFIWQPWVSM